MANGSDPSLIDIEKLLAPISEDAPTGINLSKSVMITDIEQRRKALIDGVNEGTELGESVDQAALLSNRRREWKEIEKSILALFSKGKDLAAGVGLVEALANRAGWPAMGPGFRLLRMMQEMYFEQLHPQADEEDDFPYFQRINLIERLDQDKRLPLALRQLPLTDGGGERNYTWSDYKQIEILRDGKPPKDDVEEWRRNQTQQVEEGMRNIEAAVQKTKLTFYEQMFGQLDEAATEIEALVALMDQKYSDIPEAERPSMRNVKEVLAETRNLAIRFFKKKGGKMPGEIAEEEAAAAEAAAAAGAGDDGSGAGGGKLVVSGDVTEVLQVALNQMRAREKHNPAVYLIQEAIRWSKMPIGKWYIEALNDPNLSGFISKLMQQDPAVSDGQGS